jgi:TldD protein
MPLTRREMLKLAAGAGAGAALAALPIPGPLLAQLGGGRWEPPPPIDDPRIKQLALRALDAARGAGASYADVRLTHDWNRRIDVGAHDGESLTVGVRALVEGYWGFASGPVWSPDEMARLGREACHQAKTMSQGKSRPIELAPVPAVPDGHWVMPVKLDPFEIHPLELSDYMGSLSTFAGETPDITGGVTCDLFKQEKAFASTVGTYCTQRLYLTSGQFLVTLNRDNRQLQGSVGNLSPAGMGWELFHDQPLREAFRRTLADLEELFKLPVKPIEVGRYDTLLDASAVAALVDRTAGRATELDRALGYEANAGGTSFLNDPLAMLGSYRVGGPLFTLTANRSAPGGCATVKWDDEGVAPDDFTLVKDGVLADFQTTRESAGWLKDWYAGHGRPFRSHGCANADAGISAPLQRLPNLAMAPGREAVGFDELGSRLTDGIAMKGVTIDMDFQNLNGLATGNAYQIKRGKRVAIIPGAGLLFRAPELWKAVGALGGAASVERFGALNRKGEPSVVTSHSVSAPPTVFTQLTVIDPLRKA